MPNDAQEHAHPESDALVGAARSVWDGSDARVTIQISVSERLREALSGYGADGLEGVFITDSDMRHVWKRHGRLEEGRGQADVEPEDFARLPEVLDGFETIEHVDTDKLGNRKFPLTKLIGDRYYVVTIQRGKRKLGVKTMWKRPGASCLPTERPLGLTSETTPASSEVYH